MVPVTATLPATSNFWLGLVVPIPTLPSDNILILLRLFVVRLKICASDVPILSFPPVEIILLRPLPVDGATKLVVIFCYPLTAFITLP